MNVRSVARVAADPAFVAGFGAAGAIATAATGRWVAGAMFAAGAIIHGYRAATGD